MVYVWATITSQPITENTDSGSDLSNAIHTFNDIATTFQNIWWVVSLIVLIVIAIYSIFTVQRKSIKYTEKQLSNLKANGKYIPGLFVELNESKDVLRFFLFGKKWRKRIISKYNFIYDNYYGQILKNGNTESGIAFHLKRWASLATIEKAIESAIDYHERFEKRGVKLKEEYAESEPIFELSRLRYTEALGELQHFVKAANSNYLVLTGSAGNGKTNLLCSIAELAIKIKEPVLFLNSRDIDKEIDDHILESLNALNTWQKHKNIYFRFVNLILWIKRKHLLILIDAVNENDKPKFCERISFFINEQEKYNRFKIITSCRSEYYKERFQNYISDSIRQRHLVYDVRDGIYPEAAIRRIIKRYRNYFRYSGHISDGALHVLCEHLLLLRIFFEVNKESNEDTLSICKHEVFAEYINHIKESKVSNIESILDVIADAMVDGMSFDNLGIACISNFSTAELQKTFDETVLLSKKLVYHEGTIARQEAEVVYFVFDEIRDYYIARRIMQRHSTPEAVNGKGIISDLMRIREAKVSCEEGVFQYAYVFFKTTTFLTHEERKLYCKKILDFYRPQEGHNAIYYHMKHRTEFLNYGLKILFVTGLPLEKFEKEYVRDCLRICPNEDGGKLFDTTLEGTMLGLSNNLDLYFDILFGLKDLELIGKTYSQMIVKSYDNSVQLPYDLIKYHKDICDKYPYRALQIQKAAEVYMLLFDIEEREKEDFEIICYFGSLPEHDKLREEMRQYIITAVNERR